MKTLAGYGCGLVGFRPVGQAAPGGGGGGGGDPVEPEPFDMTANLAAYWRFNANADDDWASNDLTSTSDPDFTSADYADLDTDDYFAILSNADVSVGGSSFTIAGEIWLNALGDRGITGKWSGSHGEYLMYYGADFPNRFWAQIGGDPTGFFNVAANEFGAASTDTWYLVAMVYNHVAGELKISINGGDFDVTTSVTSAADSNTMLLGADHPNPANFDIPFNFLNGRIRKWGIWNQALTQGNLVYLYNEGNVRTPV